LYVTITQKMAEEKCESWVWWCTPIIPALGRLRQKDYNFEVSQAI
jgi:hypothetical protein